MAAVWTPLLSKTQTRLRKVKGCQAGLPLIRGISESFYPSVDSVLSYPPLNDHTVA